MRELDPKDLYWVLRILPRDVRNLMRKSEGRLVLAGGFIRALVSNELANDIDLFSPSEDLARLWAQDLASQTRGDVLKTDNAYTVRGDLRLPVQFIHRWTYVKPEDIVNDFDFTVACAAIWGFGGDHGNNWHSLCADAFYADLAAKRLTYLAPKRAEDAGGSMLRVLKFYQRGYRIPLDSLGAVIARIALGVNQSTVHVLPGDTTEAKWATALTGLLREVDPLLDPEHVAHLPTSDTKSTSEL